jgi:hypothetical protein
MPNVEYNFFSISSSKKTKSKKKNAGGPHYSMYSHRIYNKPNLFFMY